MLQTTIGLYAITWKAVGGIRTDRAVPQMPPPRKKKDFTPRGGRSKPFKLQTNLAHLLRRQVKPITLGQRRRYFCSRSTLVVRQKLPVPQQLIRKIVQ